MSAQLQRITIDADQCGGAPCIRDLRIRVEDVLALIASGASPDDILHDYPYLEDDDISAAQDYAARAAGHTIIRVSR